MVPGREVVAWAQVSGAGAQVVSLGDSVEAEPLT